MSDRPQVLIDPDDLEPDSVESAPPEVDAAPRPTGRRAPLLDQIASGVQEATEGSDKVLRVGRHPTLHARYRAVDDDELERMQHRMRAQAKLRARTGQKDELEHETTAAAVYLVAACVELLVETPDGLRAVHEVLADDDQMGADAPTGPVRFDRLAAELFALDVGDEPSTVDVALALHRVDNSYASLRSAANLLQMWATGVTGKALAEAAEGN